MRNLFVCHTQAQLILACGLSSVRYKNDENHLILFQDFLLREDLKKRLDTVFSKTLYLQGIYPKRLDSFREKMKNYPINDSKIQFFMQKPYDMVFTVCDTIYPEQKCMQNAYNLNRDTCFCWLEDGIIAYYQNILIRNGLDSNSFTRFLRRLYFKYYKRLGSFYDRDFNEFGGATYNKTAYCLFPNNIREPYKSQRNIVEIRKNEFLCGLQAMYSRVVLPIKSGDVIILVDKMDTYAFPDRVKNSLKSIIEECHLLGKNVFCKFHPRETDSWDIFNHCYQLENTIGVESIYLSLSDIANDITIIGIKSTGLMSAKILGFKPISLFNSSGEENTELVNFYSNIGIEMR